MSMKKQARVYDKEFKLNAVKSYKEGDKGIEGTAKSLGVPMSTLHKWIKAFDKNGPDELCGSGKIKGSNQELHRLKKELADTALERDILKKALAIFSRQKP